MANDSTTSPGNNQINLGTMEQQHANPVANLLRNHMNELPRETQGWVNKELLPRIGVNIGTGNTASRDRESTGR